MLSKYREQQEYYVSLHLLNAECNLKIKFQNVNLFLIDYLNFRSKEESYWKISSPIFNHTLESPFSLSSSIFLELHDAQRKPYAESLSSVTNHPQQVTWHHLPHSIFTAKR